MPGVGDHVVEGVEGVGGQSVAPLLSEGAGGVGRASGVGIDVYAAGSQAIIVGALSRRPDDPDPVEGLDGCGPFDGLP